MAKLDEEMRAHETKPPARIKITLISPALNRNKAFPRLNFQMTVSNLLVARNALVSLPVLVVVST